MAQVLGAAAPNEALAQALVELDHAQKPALAAALFESVCYRVPVRDFWLHFRMWKVYHILGPARDDAAFFHAAAAVRMHPEAPGADQTFRDLFLIFLRRGREREALDLFRYQLPLQPAHPAASAGEIEPILQRLEPAAAAPPHRAPDAGASRLHPVVAEETRPPWTCPVFGGDRPRALRQLTEPMHRPAIAVAEFIDAEVLIYRNSVAVVDRAGDMRETFSVAAFPEQIRTTLAGLGESVELHEAETAVVISDQFPPPNLCHFLFDQISRLALYQRLQVDTGRALVIGPEARLPAQREILRLAGVTAHLGTDRVARVRARRLWVSSNCRDLRHAAHLGAAWAVGFVQATLGGQGTKGWRRLYISRADASARQVANEAEVMALLEPHGFERIVPGRMPYPAQLAVFRQASHVIAPHGAALAHMVLCPPGAQVLEMFHPRYGTAAYAMQAVAAGLRHAALVGRDWDSASPYFNDPSVAGNDSDSFGERHIRVDLQTLSAYLATVV